MILLQLHAVGTWTVIKAIHPRVTHQLNQILVAVGILRQHDEVVTTIVLFRLLQTLVATTGHIHLTTEDRFERFEALFFALFVHANADVVKFLNAKHIAVIGDGHAFHAIANGFIH